jgi:hypothetical protein
LLSPDAFKAEQSVLKLQVGDVIRITETDFSALSKAYFAEMRRRFT